MRLIDADALKKTLKARFSDGDDDVELIEVGAYWYHGAILEEIDNAPTIDACPYYHHEPTGEPFCEKDDRRHGTWKDINGDSTCWLCSVCDEVMCCNDNFCPNCGAKMDGKEDANKD